MMTTSQLVERLQEALGARLRSVILYGSAAGGDHAGKRSDVNVLVVAEDLSLATLDAIGATAVKWARAGNPPPLMFTLDRLKASADVFPIEIADMQACHEVLAGEPVLADLPVDMRAFRSELERELKGKLLYVREQYLLTKGRRGAVADLMIDSLSTFQVLFRAALRLFGEAFVADKQQAVERLSKHIPFEVDVFARVWKLKTGELKARDEDMAVLFGAYLKVIETVTDAVDRHEQPSG